MKNITYDRLKDAYNAYANFSSTPGKDFRTYREGYIFDEDKSVKWNREEVVRRNEAYKNERHRLMEERENLRKTFEDYALDYIIENSKITNRQKAMKLWEYISNKYDSFKRVDELDDLLDILEEVF